MADEEMKKVNFSINDGDAFYANETSITFGPAQFAFDFKNISPRVDMRNQDGTSTFVLKHNVVVLEPFQIKQFATVLMDALSKYEKQFGEIQVPEAIKKAEGELKKLAAKHTIKSHDLPTYLG